MRCNTARNLAKLLHDNSSKIVECEGLHQNFVLRVRGLVPALRYSTVSTVQDSIQQAITYSTAAGTLRGPAAHTSTRSGNLRFFKNNYDRFCLSANLWRILCTRGNLLESKLKNNDLSFANIITRISVEPTHVDPEPPSLNSTCTLNCVY